MNMDWARPKAPADRDPNGQITAPQSPYETKKASWLIFETGGRLLDQWGRGAVFWAQDGLSDEA